jgi:geranylgeranyl reductase
MRIAIIGGGPAGAQCAARLAGGGAAVTLFEPRSSYEKPCGGGLPARALRVYPFLDDPALPARRLSRCRIVAPSGRATEIPLADPLHVVRRADLHDFMLRRASRSGARLVVSRVVSFRRESGEWRLLVRADGESSMREEGPYDFLVAADGAAGASRRRLTGTIPAAGLTQGLGYFLPGVFEEAIALRFHENLDGYLWVFPRIDHASAGICGPLGTRSAAALWGLLDRFISERYGPEPLRGARRYAALIPSAAAPGDPGLQGEGWALCGDTGRAVDPLTREGIFHGMQAADLLAGALLAGRPADYAAAWAAWSGGEFAWAARHADLFFDPRFIERLVALCDVSPSVARVLSNLIAGLQPYRTLKRTLLVRAPIVAWQAATGRLLRGRRPAPPLPGRTPFSVRGS